MVFSPKFYYIFLFSTLDLTKLILLICIKLVLQGTEEYYHYCFSFLFLFFFCFFVFFCFFFFHNGRVLDNELIVGFEGLIVLVQLHGYRGCFDEERMGLLEIKEFVRAIPNVTDHLLPSWVDDHESDCCHWEQVEFFF